MTTPSPLNGSWRVRRVDDGTPTVAGIPATVPGAVHYDLIEAGLLGNPFGGSQAALDAAWVARADWEYELTFDADPASATAFAFEFDGIDTFSEVSLNGRKLGDTDNALHGYRFGVAAADLKTAGNVLTVLVRGHASAVPAERIAEAREKMGHTSDIEGLLGKSLVRRYQRNFASNSSLLNIGTAVLGIGVIGPVRLIPLPPAEVRGAFFETVELSSERAHLRTHLVVDAATVEGLTAMIELRDADGLVVATTDVTVDAPNVAAEFVVPAPRAWWPRGYGEQHLYRGVVTLRQHGVVVDEWERGVGLRTVGLVRELPNGRPTFQFTVNDVPIYVRGTNYIPVDYLKVHGSAEQFERVFALLEAGNNNLVRMWGGGATESHAFYEECDRRGILIWQDFYLHSNMYPDYDSAWVEGFREEVRELAGISREHPSLVVLCGGNEQREGWEEWQWQDLVDEFWGERLVTEVIPEVLAGIPTGVPYVDNSPHGGRWSQSPVSGESHIWGNHFNSTKDPLFVTETCWGQESYSRPETLLEVMDLDVDDYRGRGWPLRWTELTGLPVLIRFPYTNYHNVGGLREYLAGLEAEQAWADYFSMGNFRLRSPSCRGMVYWSFNKGGPLFQFGSIDYSLRPLMSFYVLARLYADVVVGVYRDNSDVHVVASNALPGPVRATVDVTHIDGRGAILDSWTREVEIATGSPQRLLDLPGLYDGVVDRTTESMYVRLSVDGIPVSDDHLLFAPVSEYLTPAPVLTGQLREAGDDEWELVVSSTGASKSVEIGHHDDLILSDNHFPLVTGRDRVVRIRALRGARLDGMTLRSLDHDGVSAVSFG